MTGAEFWSLIGTGIGVIIAAIGGAWVIWKEVRSFEGQLAEQNRQLNYRVDQQGKRSDSLYEQWQLALGEQNRRTDTLYEQWQLALAEQNKRSDRLYEMFIDLLKEGRK